MIDLLYALIRPIAFAMEPETAHDRALAALAWCGERPWAAGLLGRLCRPKALPVRVAGIDFPNPVGLAAGFDKDCALAHILPELGFGFLELGTVTPKPQPGNPKPRIWRVKTYEGLINQLGFNNAGAEAAAAALTRLGRRQIPIGINIGRNADTPQEKAAQDFVSCLKTLHALGDYFTLNISSPNTSGLRELHAEDKLKRLLSAALDLLAKLGPKPLFLKISPDLDHETLVSVCKLVRELKVGVVAVNTTLRRDLISSQWAMVPGGLSGRPLKGLANAMVRGVRDLTAGEVPVIGVGGISSLVDAQLRFDSGADLVQVYTGLIYRGPGLVREIVEGLRYPSRDRAKVAA